MFKLFFRDHREGSCFSRCDTLSHVSILFLSHILIFNIKQKITKKEKEESHLLLHRKQKDMFYTQRKCSNHHKPWTSNLNHLWRLCLNSHLPLFIPAITLTQNLHRKIQLPHHLLPQIDLPGHPSNDRHVRYSNSLR